MYGCIQKFLQFQLTVRKTHTHTYTHKPPPYQHTHTHTQATWYRSKRPSLTRVLQVTVVAVILAIVGSIIWDESPLTTVQMLWVRNNLRHQRTTHAQETLTQRNAHTKTHA